MLFDEGKLIEGINLITSDQNDRKLLNFLSIPTKLIVLHFRVPSEFILVNRIAVVANHIDIIIDVIATKLSEGVDLGNANKYLNFTQDIWSRAILPLLAETISNAESNLKNAYDRLSENMNELNKIKEKLLEKAQSNQEIAEELGNIGTIQTDEMAQKKKTLAMIEEELASRIQSLSTPTEKKWTDWEILFKTDYALKISKSTKSNIDNAAISSSAETSENVIIPMNQAANGDMNLGFTFTARSPSPIMNPRFTVTSPLLPNDTYHHNNNNFFINSTTLNPKPLEIIQEGKSDDHPSSKVVGGGEWQDSSSTDNHNSGQVVPNSQLSLEAENINLSQTTPKDSAIRKLKLTSEDT